MAKAPLSGRLGDFFSNSREKGQDDLPIFSVTMREGLVRRDSIDRKTDSELEDGEHLRVRKGDIAYNMMRMWQGASGLAKGDGIVSPAYVVLRPKKTVDPLFASYWFKSERMIYLFWAYSYGITNDRLRLYYKDFASIPAAMPDLQTQRRIASTLAECDRAILTTERLVESKRRRKRALMQQLLFSACADRQYAALADVSGINVRALSGKTPPDLKFEYFPIAANSDDETDASGWMEFANSPSRARRLAQTDDVIYSTVRPLLRRCFRAPANPSAVYSTGYAILGGGPRLNPKYLLHLMTSWHIERQIYARIAGSNYPAISSADLGELQVPIPSAHEQETIANLLDAIDQEVDLLAAQAIALRQQKRGLMQKFLPDEWMEISPLTEAAAA